MINIIWKILQATAIYADKYAHVHIQKSKQKKPQVKYLSISQSQHSFKNIFWESLDSSTELRKIKNMSEIQLEIYENFFKFPLKSNLKDRRCIENKKWKKSSILKDFLVLKTGSA